PHIVRVYDFGRGPDDQPYFVLEYVGGGSLAGKLKADGRFAPRAAAELVADLADAMAAAHAQGVVHRDLKPANVLLTRQGAPKITDFGLAKVGGSDATATGAVMGTPQYMAPEQAAGRTKEVGTAADVYALGVILYELLTGVPPFRGKTAVAVIQKVLNDQPERPRARVADLPRDLETVCLKCLEKEPGARYPTARALADDLRRFLAGEPVSVRPAGFAERAYKWARRKPTVAALYAATAAGVVLVGVTAAFALLWQDADQAKATAESERAGAETARQEAVRARDRLADEQGRTEAARKEAEAARDDARQARDVIARFEYGRTIQLTYQAWKDNDIVTARSLLASTDEPLRGWEYHYVHRLCHGDLLTLKGHQGKVETVDWSADGARILTEAGGLVRLWDAETGAEIAKIRTTGTFRRIRDLPRAPFSPDGKLFITFTDGHPVAILRDARTGTEVKTLVGHSSTIETATWSNDGTKIVTGSRDGTARVWDSKTGQPITVFRGHVAADVRATGVRTATWSPDGSQVATTGYDNMLRLWDPSTAKESLPARAHGANGSCCVWSPDAARLLT
ncbi:MAG: protein kinase, partial [Gemmataceae bacterium]|nr:protein kinase [Gemmataceae bacterium]